MTQEELDWVSTYQSYLANFIRHGDPNNWTDNPNEKPSNEIVWPRAKTGSVAQLGLDQFSVYSYDDDLRKDRCDMLDDINHYMLH